MKKEVKKSEHYVLIIDRQRQLILESLLESGFRNPIGNAIFHAFAQMNEVDMKEMEAFLTEVHEKKHSLGWCENPNCKFNKKDYGDRDGTAEAKH